MFAMPAPTMVTVVPLTVATAGLSLVMVTGFPVGADVTVTVNGEAPTRHGGMGSMVMI